MTVYTHAIRARYGDALQLRCDAVVVRAIRHAHDLHTKSVSAAD